MDRSEVGIYMFFGVEEVDAKHLHPLVVLVWDNREHEADVPRSRMTKQGLSVRRSVALGRSVVRGTGECLGRVSKRLARKFLLARGEQREILFPEQRMEGALCHRAA